MSDLVAETSVPSTVGMLPTYEYVPAGFLITDSLYMVLAPYRYFRVFISVGFAASECNSAVLAALTMHSAMPGNAHWMHSFFACMTISRCAITV